MTVCVWEWAKDAQHQAQRKKINIDLMSNNTMLITLVCVGCLQYFFFSDGKSLTIFHSLTSL